MFQKGQLVCTNEILGSSGFTKDEQSRRRPDAIGIIVRHSDSHGLCYQVRHENGKQAWYDPDEIQTIDMNKICLMVYSLSEMAPSNENDPRVAMAEKICACLQILAKENEKK